MCMPACATPTARSTSSAREQSRSSPISDAGPRAPRTSAQPSRSWAVGEGGGQGFFTTGHCVFGNDAPFDAEQGRMLMRETINAVNSLAIPKAEKDRIFAGNARSLLKLN